MHKRADTPTEQTNRNHTTPPNVPAYLPIPYHLLSPCTMSCYNSRNGIATIRSDDRASNVQDGMHMRKALQMKNASPDLWLGAGTLLLVVFLLLIFLHMRAIIPDNGLVTGLLLIPVIAGIICFTLSIILRSRGKS